jgi:hypothetical protein
MFIGLNPSTADEMHDDPTIRRCKEFARSWGCDALVMTNLFAWRSTDPREMKAAEDPIGQDNDEWLERIAELAHVRVAAWGVHGFWLERAMQVAAVLPDLQCLGTTKDGHPRHPLYVAAATPLEAWPEQTVKVPHAPDKVPHTSIKSKT